MREILNSVKRGRARLFTLLAIGAFLLMLSNYAPLALGAILAPLSFGFGLAALGLALGDLFLRILQPSVNSQQAAAEAMKDNNTAAGLVYLGRAILLGVILLLLVRQAEPVRFCRKRLFLLYQCCWNSIKHIGQNLKRLLCLGRKWSRKPA
jgi:hypothetical protein